MDAFLVRTLLVPSLVALLGRRNSGRPVPPLSGARRAAPGAAVTGTPRG